MSKNEKEVESENDFWCWGQSEMVEELERLTSFENDFRKVKHDIDQLVDYDYSDEEEHFNENGKPESHIFQSKVAVENFSNKYKDEK